MSSILMSSILMSSILMSSILMSSIFRQCGRSRRARLLFLVMFGILAGSARRGSRIDQRRLHPLAVGHFALVADDDFVVCDQRHFLAADQLDNFHFLAVVIADAHALPVGLAVAHLQDEVLAFA